MNNILLWTAALLISSGASYGVEKKNTITAQDQGRGTTSDVETTRKIRELLMADDGLSTGAKNVSVVTLNGAITIKGNVEDSSEMRKVEMTAKNAAGPGFVIKNQLKTSR